MIHAVHAANQHLYARQLDEMFRRRGARDEVGVLVTDARDNLSAVYLMRLDGEGRLAESVRLNPLPAAKAGAGAGGAEAGADEAWEATLWPPSPSDELVAGVREFCAA